MSHLFDYFFSHFPCCYAIVFFYLCKWFVIFSFPVRNGGNGGYNPSIFTNNFNIVINAYVRLEKKLSVDAVTCLGHQFMDE